MTTLIRPHDKGPITIPDEIREALGIEDDSLLRLTVEDGELRIKPLPVHEQEEGSPWLRELYDYFAPVREEILAKGYTEDEVNAAIDEALREVRAENPVSW